MNIYLIGCEYAGKTTAQFLKKFEPHFTESDLRRIKRPGPCPRLLWRKRKGPVLPSEHIPVAVHRDLHAIGPHGYRNEIV